MKLSNPLIVRFTNTGSDITMNDDILTVPIRARWNDFKRGFEDALQNPDYDYVVTSFSHIPPEVRDDASVLKSLNIHEHAIERVATDKGLRVFNRFEDNIYFVNPSYDEFNSAKGYAPSDDTVLTKVDSYPNHVDWENHQAKVFSRLAVDMPLTTGEAYEKTNHKALLMAPNRGLKEEDLDGFFSWKPNTMIVPELAQDDMVGMPSMLASTFDDLEVEYKGRSLGVPIGVKTIGSQGYAIPMRNIDGNSPKYQIGTDITPINIVLKARAKDGISIQKSEFFDKKAGRRGEYKFTIDGEPSHLTVAYANNDGVTMTDVKGDFDVNIKQDIKDVLVERGYEIPELIDTLKPVPGAKYIWMSPGTMVGSRAINESKTDGILDEKTGEISSTNRVAPSMAGFIEARAPREGKDDYVLVVAEGALKGAITAKKLDAKDANGKSVADYIGSNHGIIVAQIAGVSPKMVETVGRIHEAKNIIGTYVAMDADGRDNLNVARGIHSAEKIFKSLGPTKIMSWDPAQKGIDDALLAIERHDITVDDMKITFGSAEKLFPLEQAEQPNPYKLDGTRANKPQWLDDYHQSLAVNAKKIEEMQANSTTVITASEEAEKNAAHATTMAPARENPDEASLDLSSLEALEPAEDEEILQ